MLKQHKLNKAILYTLAYSDVFNSPLTLEELHVYLYKFKISKDKLRDYLKNIGFVQNISGYYVFNGRENIVTPHLIKKKESERKLLSIQKVIKLLEKIPTINLISISGSVAVSSADKNSDVDLFIITKPNTLWITRAIVTLILKILRKKRSPLISISPDSICTNMWMSSEKLDLPVKSVFHAREVVQMKVLLDRNNQHQNFMRVNSWVNYYFPNYFSEIKKVNKSGMRINFFWKLFDLVAYKLQMIYMKRKMTTEKVSRDFAAFHPKDVSKSVIELYEQKVKLYESIFNKLSYQNTGDVKNIVQDTFYITPGS